MFEEFMTSRAWMQMDMNNHATYIILDPDGWDRQNYDYSFYEEKITYEEYNRRKNMSTVMLGFAEQLREN